MSICPSIWAECSALREEHKESREKGHRVLFSFTVGLLPWDEACEGKLAGAPAAVGSGRFVMCWHKFQVECKRVLEVISSLEKLWGRQEAF